MAAISGRAPFFAQTSYFSEAPRDRYEWIQHLNFLDKGQPLYTFAQARWEMPSIAEEACLSLLVKPNLDGLDSLIHHPDNILAEIAQHYPRACEGLQDLLSMVLNEILGKCQTPASLARYFAAVTAIRQVSCFIDDGALEESWHLHKDFISSWLATHHSRELLELSPKNEAYLRTYCRQALRAHYIQLLIAVAKGMAPHTEHLLQLLKCNSRSWDQIVSQLLEKGHIHAADCELILKARRWESWAKTSDFLADSLPFESPELCSVLASPQETRSPRFDEMLERRAIGTMSPLLLNVAAERSTTLSPKLFRALLPHSECVNLGLGKMTPEQREEAFYAASEPAQKRSILSFMLKRKDPGTHKASESLVLEASLEELLSLMRAGHVLGAHTTWTWHKRLATEQAEYSLPLLLALTEAANKLTPADYMTLTLCAQLIAPYLTDKWAEAANGAQSADAAKPLWPMLTRTKQLLRVWSRHCDAITKEFINNLQLRLVAEAENLVKSLQ